MFFCYTVGMGTESVSTVQTDIFNPKDSPDLGCRKITGIDKTWQSFPDFGRRTVGGQQKNQL